MDLSLIPQRSSATPKLPLTVWEKDVVSTDTFIPSSLDTFSSTVDFDRSLKIVAISKSKKTKPEWLKFLLKHVSVNGVSDVKLAETTIMNTKLSEILYNYRNPNFVLRDTLDLKWKPQQRQSLGIQIGLNMVDRINEEFKLSPRPLSLSDIFDKTPLEIKQLLTENKPLPEYVREVFSAI